MRTTLLTLLWLGGLASSCLPVSAVTLQTKMTTRQLASQTDCQEPTPATRFLTTDERVYIWYLLNNTQAGDKARIEWYAPDGTFYSGFDWNPLSNGGGRCFWAWVNINNQPAALKLGEWTAKVAYNGGPLFEQKFTLAAPTVGGAVVIDGTDSADHGEASGGVNKKGWLYMQRVLESLARQSLPGAAKVVVALGATSGSRTRQAMDSAFNLSSLPLTGWTLRHVDGTDSISLWLSNLSTTNTGILWLPTYNHVAGDLEPSEMAAVNARAVNIARYFTGNGNAAQGGLLFAMAESDVGTKTGAWQWLRTLFPNIEVENYGEEGIRTDLKLTLDGANLITGLTNADLVGAQPWHNAFYNVSGRLKVLGTGVNNNGTTRQVILGGQASDLTVKPCALDCTVSAPTEATAGFATAFAASYSLSSCSGTGAAKWEFGDGAISYDFLARHTYATAGTYTWKVTINAAEASPCVRTGQVTVKSNCPAPVITAHPQSRIVPPAGPLTLSVKATGKSPLRYQWYEGPPGDISTPVGSNADTLTVAAPSADSSFWVKVSDECGSKNSKPALITTSRPLVLEFVDPACEDKTRCEGQLLMPQGDSVAINTQDLKRLADWKVTRLQAVADGVTLLLLRVASDLPVTFTLREGKTRLAGAEKGVLLPLSGAGAGSNSIQVQPLTAGNKKYAFALYRVPIDYPISSPLDTTGVIVEAATAAKKSSQFLRLLPPPLVLVHGVWSNGDAWRGLEQNLANQGYFICDICRVDYGSIEPAGSFDPKQPGESIFSVIRAVNSARTALRRTGIAATQVDIIGHSMGGLVARARASKNLAQLSPYLRLDNYLKGDFHKLITVGTPHLGTLLANHLTDYKDVRTTLGITFGKFWEGFLPEKPLGPAIYGFRTDSKPLQNIGATNVRSHAIYGIEPELSLTEGLLDSKLALLPLTNSLDVILSGEKNHDTIVPASSQQGNLQASATSRIEGVVHADLGTRKQPNFYGGIQYFDFSPEAGETDSSDVWAVIGGLLRASANSDKFDTFPAFSPSAPGELGQAAQVKVNGRPAQTSAATVTLSPPPGSIVQAGSALSITLEINGGNEVDGAVFVVAGQEVIVNGTGPFSLLHPLPPAFAGRLEIKAFTFGQGPENYLASTFVMVAPTSPLVSLTTNLARLELASVGERFPLRVYGQYQDGKGLELTSGTTGTIYATKSGTASVVSVSSEGIIEVKGTGQETILVSNSGKTAEVRVYVYPDGNTPGTQVTSVSAATYALAPLAPESLVSAFGTNFTATTAAAVSLPLPTSLGGVEVRVTDSAGTERLAPLFYVSPTQINYQIPPGTAAGAAVITVVRGDEIPAIETVLIDSVSPGLFAANADGRGVAAAYAVRVSGGVVQPPELIAQFDNALNKFVARPIDLGPDTDQLFLVLFGTGLRFNSGLGAVTAKIGGIDAVVDYAGAQPQYAGLDQVNLRLPRSLKGRGEVEIRLSIGGEETNPVTINIR